MKSDKVINCIPPAMPFIDSIFMPYALGNKPFSMMKIECCN